MITTIDCRVQLWQDTAGQDILFAPSQTESRVTFSNMDEECSDRFTLAPSATGVAVAFGSVGTAAGFYLLAEGNIDVTISVNSDTITIPLRRSSSSVARENVVLFIPAAVTAVTMANPSSTVAVRGRYAVYGDPV